MLKSPEKLLNELIEADGIAPDMVSGCSDFEIRELERTFDVVLPESYKKFLRVMGKDNGSGDFFSSYCPFHYLRVDTFQFARRIATDRLEETNYKLTVTDFVFLFGNDTTFCWFDTAAGSNPPVTSFDEMDEEGPQLNRWADFLTFLNFVVDDYVESVS